MLACTKKYALMYSYIFQYKMQVGTLLAVGAIAKALYGLNL
jgi:hypothetical protein